MKCLLPIRPPSFALLLPHLPMVPDTSLVARRQHPDLYERAITFYFYVYYQGICIGNSLFDL